MSTRGASEVSGLDFLQPASTTPYDMKQDDDRRASENRDDTEPTQRRCNLRPPDYDKIPAYQIIMPSQRTAEGQSSDVTDSNDSDNDSTATSPYDMKQDYDCRASENRADTELTQRHSHLRKMSPQDETEIIMPDDSDNDSTAPPPYDMDQDYDCRASVNRADTELTQSIPRDPREKNGPPGGYGI